MKHILVECVDLEDVRNKHFVASSIKDSFDNIEAHKIIGVRVERYEVCGVFFNFFLYSGQTSRRQCS